MECGRGGRGGAGGGEGGGGGAPGRHCTALRSKQGHLSLLLWRVCLRLCVCVWAEANLWSSETNLREVVSWPVSSPKKKNRGPQRQMLLEGGDLSHTLFQQNQIYFHPRQTQRLNMSRKLISFAYLFIDLLLDVRTLLRLSFARGQHFNASTSAVNSVKL